MRSNVASQLLVILGIVALIMMLFVVILKLRYVFLRRTEDNEKYENRKCIKTYIKDGNANGYINDGKFVV
ncbi:hypothetical protein WMO38_02140 [Lachnospira sp. CLA-JM-H10]|uniref:Uncharacterized protein n=1 Tax=Lachnospira intestinalis TaxID=3133158 RepID=A0ABV1GKD0_9FIRM